MHVGLRKWMLMMLVSLVICIMVNNVGSLIDFCTWEDSSYFSRLFHGHHIVTAAAIAAVDRANLWFSRGGRYDVCVIQAWIGSTAVDHLQERLHEIFYVEICHWSREDIWLNIPFPTDQPPGRGGPFAATMISSDATSMECRYPSEGESLTLLSLV